MIFIETQLPGSYLINLELIEDDRGFFSRFYCLDKFKSVGLNTYWPQVNNSLSKREGTLRGLHFQRPPHSEVKLIRCLSGAIWDVIVDLRKSSPFFGKWYAAELSAQNRTAMYVPQGFAHGFITLMPNTEVIYFVSCSFAPEAEGALVWNDPDVGIKWPILPKVISEKDKIAPRIFEISPISI